MRLLFFDAIDAFLMQLSTYKLTLLLQKSTYKFTLLKVVKFYDSKT